VQLKATFYNVTIASIGNLSLVTNAAQHLVSRHLSYPRKGFFQMKKIRILSEDSGSILVMTSVSLVAILAILGFAVDVGHLRLVKRNLQNAADAAALAAAIEVRICGDSPNCSAMQSAARNALVENGLTPSATLTNCAGTAAGAGITLTINSPVCAVSSDPNAGKTNYAEAIVSQPVSMYFARLIGMNNITVKARAEAARGIGGPCIYALDPTGPAIVVVAGVLVKSNCDIVDESSSSDALSCVVGAFIYAPRISVTGDTAGLLCLASSRPRTHVPPPTPRDPLGYLPPPPNANAACGVSTGSPYFGSSKPVAIALIGNTVFNPGVYCGGISLTANLLSNVTFNPGVYVLRDKNSGLLNLPSGGLQLTLSLLSNVTGNGVTFYNEGPAGTITVTEPVTGASLLSLSNVSLSAPTSGEYGGVLFFQAHGVTAPATALVSLIGSSNLQGAFYFPDAPLSYAVSAIASSYNIIVAKDIYLTVGVATTFGNDYSTLQSGSPLNGDNATLVQ
jgi:hypothetical protein